MDDEWIVDDAKLTSLTPRFRIAEHSDRMALGDAASLFGPDPESPRRTYRDTAGPGTRIRDESVSLLHLVHAADMFTHPYSSRHLQPLMIIDHRLLDLARRFAVLALGLVRLLPEIALERDQHELGGPAVVGNLADPLGLDVLQRVFRADLSPRPRRRLQPRSS